MNSEAAQAIIDAVNGGWPNDQIRPSTEPGWLMGLAPLDFDVCADFILARSEGSYAAPTLAHIQNHHAAWLDRQHVPGSTERERVRSIFAQMRRDIDNRNRDYATANAEAAVHRGG